jgi:hypothetical protein
MLSGRDLAAVAILLRRSRGWDCGGDDDADDDNDEDDDVVDEGVDVDDVLLPSASSPDSGS